MAKAKKLKSGNWCIQLYYGKKADGSNDYRRRTFTNEIDANIFALEHEKKRRDILHDKTNMTLGEAIDEYIKTKDGVLSPATIAGYKRQRKNCLQDIIDIKLNKLTQKSIQGSVNTMAKEGKSSKYIHNAHGLLSAVLKQYIPDFRLTTTLPQTIDYEPNIPSDADIDKIIDIVKNTEIELPVLLALWLGLRMSEIRGIEKQNIKDGILHIKQAIVDIGKGESALKGTKSKAGNRKMRLPQYIIDLINKLPNDQTKITELSGQAIYKRFSRLCEANGLEHFRFHDLRHSNASVMLSLNIPDKYAMERMGHATNRTLKKVYQHTMSEKQIQVADAVDNYYKSKISHEISHEKQNQ